MTDSDAIDAVRDLLAAHTAADYPESLGGGEEVEGVALVMLDADLAGLAAAFVGGDGVLRPDQWWTLRESAADVRAVVPRLEGDAWVYFARLYAISQAMLKLAPASPG